VKTVALVLTALHLLVPQMAKGGGAAKPSLAVYKACPGVVQGVYYYRGKTRLWERKLGLTPSKSNFNAAIVHSCKYTIWVAHQWAKKAHKAHHKYVVYLHQQALLYSDPEYAICSVFGPYCDQAKKVALCEGGYDPNAHNGQYLGTFQMGSHERRLYGHGSTVLAQAQAAWRYFVASNKSWGPWQCKPY